MGLKLVPFGLPAVIAIAGVALVAFGGDFGQGAGVALLGVALLVVLLNLYVRRGLASERDRRREEERRGRR